MTLFPAEPNVVAPWLLVIRVLDPAGTLYAVPFMAHSIRQAEEMATRFVDTTDPLWRVDSALLAASPVEVRPSPRRWSVGLRS